MDSLTRNPRPSRSLKPVDDACEEPQVIASDGHYVWLNSSFELEHGLEVVELNRDVHRHSTAGREPLKNVEAGSQTAYCPQLWALLC